MTLENFNENRYLNYIRDAVYAVAHSIKEAILSKCKGAGNKQCDHTSINGESVLTHLKNITFNGNLF